MLKMSVFWNVPPCCLVEFVPDYTEDSHLHAFHREDQKSHFVESRERTYKSKASLLLTFILDKNEN